MAAAWVLNLDADVELAFGGGYVASERVVAMMAPHVERARGLLGDGDILVGPRAHARGQSAQSGSGAQLGGEPMVAGMVGRAWCPTPSAVARLVAAGAVPEAHPAFEVLRWVNSRAFSASLGQTLPGAVFVTELDTAIAAIGPNTRLKRNYGMAGRGQRVVDRVDDATLGYLRAGMLEGGVQIEPNLRIEAEYARHGFLSPEGELTVGRLVRQRCDAHGQWLSSELSEGPGIELEPVARALHRAGYFGPFGVDAFVYEGGYQPRSEINARYSMGYAIGLMSS